MGSSDRSRALIFLIGVVIATGLWGCTRDPAVAKQRYFDRAQKFMEEQKYWEAAIEFRNAVKIDPSFAAGHYQLGLASKRLQWWGEAAKAFQRTLELDPEQTEAAVELGEIYLRANAPKRAGTLAEGVLRREPENWSARILLAKSYMGMKEFDRARVEFEKAEQLEPENATVYLATGVAEIGAGHPGAAEAKFKAALALDGSRTETYHNLANLYRALNRGGEAERILVEGVRGNPANIKIHLELAKHYYQTGRMDQVDSVLKSLQRRAKDRVRLHESLGDFWTSHHEVSRAGSAYQASLSFQSSERVKKKLISAYITLGDAAKAERLNGQILAEHRGDREAKMFRGAIAYLRGDAQGAVQELVQIVATDPGALFAHYYLGAAYLDQGALALSRKQFYECIRLNEKFVHAYIRLGELSLRKKDAASAAEYAKQVIALSPRRLEGYLLAAEAAILKKDPATAARALKVASRLAPDDYLIHEHWAAVHSLRRNYARAEGEYRKALATSPQPEGTLARMVRFYIDRGWIAKGLNEVQRYMDSRAASPRLYELLAQLHLAQGGWTEAARACEQALRLDPSRVTAQVYRSQALVGQGRLEEARRSYEQTVQRNPRELAPYLHLADLYWYQGEFDRAGEYYRQALDVAPSSLVAQTGLARALADAGQNLDWALSLAQQARQQRPEEPLLSDALAWVYHKKGLDHLAIPLLEECVAERKDEPLFQYHLGMAYLQAGKKAKAEAMLRAALKNGLGKPYASVAEEQLSLVKGEPAKIGGLGRNGLVVPNLRRLTHNVHVSAYHGPEPGLVPRATSNHMERNGLGGSFGVIMASYLLG